MSQLSEKDAARWLYLKNISRGGKLTSLAMRSAGMTSRDISHCEKQGIIERQEDHWVIDVNLQQHIRRITTKSGR